MSIHSACGTILQITNLALWSVDLLRHWWFEGVCYMVRYLKFNLIFDQFIWFNVRSYFFGLWVFNFQNVVNSLLLYKYLNWNLCCEKDYNIYILLYVEVCDSICSSQRMKASGRSDGTSGWGNCAQSWCRAVDASKCLSSVFISILLGNRILVTLFTRRQHVGPFSHSL